MNFFKQHTQAFIGATIYTIGVLLLLFLLGFTIPTPPPVEECILLDFGGGGNPNAGLSANSATTSKTNTSTQNSNSNSNSNYVDTQAFEDAASLPTSNVKTEKTTEKTTNQEPTTNPSPEPKLNSNLDKLGFGNLSGGSGSGTGGNGTGSGNPGYGGGSGSGGGNGTAGPGGIGGKIGSRKVNKVEPVGKDNMTGEVVLRITVNEYGKVESVIVVRSNCNECTQLAITAVKKWKYEPKPGSGTQTGEVTVEFKQK